MSIGTNLSTDRGPLINLAEWITATGVILAFAGKIYTKWQMAKYLDLNDAFVGAATVSMASHHCGWRERLHGEELIN
jgi:hypothetical protein